MCSNIDPKPISEEKPLHGTEGGGNAVGALYAHSEGPYEGDGLPPFEDYSASAHRKHRGSIAELAACQWLMARGFEVFRNVSQSGPVDIIAFNEKTGNMFKIDVKCQDSAHVRRDGTVSYTMSKKNGFKARGIHLMIVRMGRVIGFFDYNGGPCISLYDPFELEEKA